MPNSSISNFSKYKKDFIAFFKFLGCSLVFLLSLMLIFDYIIVVVIQQIKSNGMYKVHRIINQNNPDEIAIIGSSRALGNIVPGMIDKNAFNYGLNGIGMDVAVFFLQQELKKNKKPPVIINFDPWGVNKNFGEIGNYKLDYANPAIRKMIPDQEKSVFYFIPGMRFLGDFKSVCTSWLLEKYTVTKKVDQGAELLLVVRTKNEFDLIENKTPNWSFKIDPEISNEFQSAIKSTDRMIYIVIAPVSKVGNQKFKNKNDLDAYLQLLANNKNVRILNFLESYADYDFDCWQDSNHLNYQAAQRFTQRIIDKMREDK